MQNFEVTRIVNKAISHSGVVLFDMMNQHTENINDFLRPAFNKHKLYCLFHSYCSSIRIEDLFQYCTAQYCTATSVLYCLFASSLESLKE